MENSPNVIRSPSPFFESSPPLSQPDNTTNSGSPPPPLPFSSSPQVYPIVTVDPPPPLPPSVFTDSPRSVDLSPLEFILALMAVITIPAIIYAFFFTVKCPPWSTSRREHDDDDHHHHEQDSQSRELPIDNHGNPVLVFKYRTETHSKDIGIECSVCLSCFGDGEEVKQLSRCQHSFHATCIDLWLQNHNNCPICRASVAVNRPNINNNRTARFGSARNNGDFHQGLPDAAGLV